MSLIDEGEVGAEKKKDDGISPSRHVRLPFRSRESVRPHSRNLSEPGLQQSSRWK